MTHPIQPGWYDDPDGSPNAERRWDGHNWTTERRRKAAQPAPPSAYSQYAPQQPAYPQAGPPPYPEPYLARASYSQAAPRSEQPQHAPAAQYSQHVPPPQYPQPPYPPQSPAPYATAAHASNLFSIIAFVCAGASVLFFPILFGLAALILGAVGWTKKERFAPIALAAAAAVIIAWVLLGMTASGFLVY